MKVVFSDRAYAAVLAETAEKVKTETGGLFLGAWEDGCWYIVEAIDPGPRSVFEVAYFEYDREYTQHLINKVANLYHMKLELIGLWHRHPGSFDVFSTTDNGTNAKYAKMRKEGAISAIANLDPAFRLTMYHVARPCSYKKIEYEVGDALIPEKYLKYKSPERFGRMMQESLFPKKKGVGASSFQAILEKAVTQMEDRSCTERIEETDLCEQDVREKLVEGLLDDITYLAEKGVALSIVQGEKYLTLVEDGPKGMVKLYCMYDGDAERIIIQYLGKAYHYTPGLLKDILTGEHGENHREDVADNTEDTVLKQEG